MPSMLWFVLPSSEVHPSVWPPRRTREILETLGALFLSQTTSWSSKERKNKTLCLICSQKQINNIKDTISGSIHNFISYSTKNSNDKSLLLEKIELEMVKALFLSKTTSWSSKERKNNTLCFIVLWMLFAKVWLHQIEFMCYTFELSSYSVNKIQVYTYVKTIFRKTKRN